MKSVINGFPGRLDVTGESSSELDIPEETFKPRKQREKKTEIKKKRGRRICTDGRGPPKVCV